MCERHTSAVEALGTAALLEPGGEPGEWVVAEPAEGTGPLYDFFAMSP